MLMMTNTGPDLPYVSGQYITDDKLSNIGRNAP